MKGKGSKRWVFPGSFWLIFANSDQFFLADSKEKVKKSWVWPIFLAQIQKI